MGQPGAGGNPAERDKMWSGLAAHICHFFRLTARKLVFRDKKCHILTFHDKTVLNNVNAY